MSRRTTRRPFAAAVLLVVVLAALPSRPAGAIIGGQEADVGEWPWQVALLINGQQACGGSLIAPDVVVTAAHCTDGEAAEDLTVAAGVIDLRARDRQVRGVARLAQHPDWNRSDSSNDISLLFLSSGFDLGPTVAVIGIAAGGQERELTENGDPAVVTGWGALSEDGDTTPVLREAEVEIFDDRQCEANYVEDDDNDVDGATQVCAGRHEGGVDSCYGDSGGPLVVPTDESRSTWLLVGIVSWAAGCGIPERPTIHTEVSEFADWIAEQGVALTPSERFDATRPMRLPATGSKGKASAYPSRLTVQGLAGPVSSVSLELHGLTHERPADLDIWLVAPDGTAACVLSDVGGNDPIDEINVFVTGGGNPAGDALVGRLAPTDEEVDTQRKGTRAPADLAVFEGVDGNGTWQLLVADDHGGATGSLLGWTLIFR